MYFTTCTPESVGISSKTVLKFIKTLDSYKLCTHDIIMAKGDKIFFECYYAPFSKDFKHRMYSVTKSFVAIAVLMAVDDGLIALDDKFIKYFPESENENINEFLKEATIKDMLTMESSVHNGNEWFLLKPETRFGAYFENTADKISGTLFAYDSSGSYMLGVIVERVTGKPFLEYMKEKALNDIGFSQDSYCLKAPGGYSWGDSALLCTARDLLLFAKFVMNKGSWNGKQYVSRHLMEEAVSNQVCNDNTAVTSAYGSYGYGYQIWMNAIGGFSFVGMGDQFAICDPKNDFIFIINSDNQGSQLSRPILHHELFNSIIPAFGEVTAEDEKAFNELNDYISDLKLCALEENADNPFINEIKGVRYELTENPMGIEYVKFDFDGRKGYLSYKNKQGEKKLAFGIGYNEFGKFPQEGYSDMVGTKFAPGNFYDCACSADWAEDRKLRIKVQIIDKYFGNGCWVFSFKDNRIMISMAKTAEDFMNEYAGIAMGKKSD